MSEPATWQGYLRPDGRKGIRNLVLVVYLVECARFVAEKIAADDPDHLHCIGFGGCYPNDYSVRMLEALCTHPNTGATLLVSLGCESFDRHRLARTIAASGRPVHTISIQAAGGTRPAIDTALAWTRTAVADLAATPRTTMGPADLIIGTICGGSDATSGITANPVIGLCFDRLIAAGATAIFEETGELIGCQSILANRAATADLAIALRRCIDKAADYHRIMGHGSFATGNAEGGLTTQEEKSLGACANSGHSPITGILKPAEQPGPPGLYLLDVVPDGEPRFGFPNINDSAEITELIACGSHLVLFATGRGSVVGSALAPVVKICANPETHRRMAGDMDLNTGAILEGTTTLDTAAADLLEIVHATAAGRPTASEALGHREFVLGYKRFDTDPTVQPLIQPTCHPG